MKREEEKNKGVGGEKQKRCREGRSDLWEGRRKIGNEMTTKCQRSQKNWRNDGMRGDENERQDKKRQWKERLSWWS
jgi:hypothetical protein